MLDLTFYSPETRVVVHPDVIEQLAQFRQMRSNDPEACGVLLGKQYPTALEVTDITEPQVTDVRSRTGYWRERNGHTHRAMLRRQESGV